MDRRAAASFGFKCRGLTIVIGETAVLVCFLAYVLWKALAASCRQAGLGDEPRQVFEELSEITLVDVVLPKRNGVEVHKRCVSQPTEHQRILLQRLG